MKQLKGKESVQGSRDFRFAWRGGQEAPATPQSGIPELNPTRFHTAGEGGGAFAEITEQLLGLFLGSLDGGGTRRSPGAVCHGGTGRLDAVGYGE